MKVDIRSELIEQVKTGDEKAFTELFELTYKNVYYLALKICKNDDDAKEVAQLTFLQVRRSISSLRDNKTFIGWLRRITMSKCYNLFDHNRDSVYDPMESKLYQNQDEKRIYMLPKKQARFQSDKEVIMNLIDELSEKYSTVLVLMYFEEMSIIEISETLNIPEGTVKSRLSTARSLLQSKVLSYEQANDIRLDFQMVDGVALMSVFAACYAKINIAVPVITTALPSLSLLSKAKHLLATSGAKVVLVSALAVVGSASTYAIHKNFDNKKEEETASVQDINSQAFKYNEKESLFPSVEIKNITYDTSRDAYFELLKWAHCEVELQEMPIDEITTYKPLYSALKQANSTYYEALSIKGWTTIFEKIEIK